MIKIRIRIKIGIRIRIVKIQNGKQTHRQTDGQTLSRIELLRN